MICQTCGAHLEPEECAAVLERFPYGEGEVEWQSGMTCPVCGGEDLRDAADCADCGGEVATEELDNGLCRLCVAQLAETLDWMSEQLSPAQKQWMLAHPEWVEQ